MSFLVAIVTVCDCFLLMSRVVLLKVMTGMQLIGMIRGDTRSKIVCSEVFSALFASPEIERPSCRSERLDPFASH